MSRKKIALERIEILFSEAEKAALESNIEKANEYVGLARKIGKRTNTSIPRKFKPLFCKNCYRFLLEGKTAETRLNSQQKRVETTCQQCGYENYYPY